MARPELASCPINPSCGRRDHNLLPGQGAWDQQANKLRKHRYANIKEYDHSGINRSFVRCNRSVWAPATGHKRGSNICSECNVFAKQPVGFCTPWCFDQYIYAISTGDEEHTAATSARRKAHNTKTYQFGNPEYVCISPRWTS